MKLMTKEIEKKLAKNKPDHSGNKPYLKLFNPLGSQRWLISEYNPKTGIMYGLCDLAMESPELGIVSLREIEEIDVGLGLGIERDIFFEPKKTLAEYAEIAYRERRIVL